MTEKQLKKLSNINEQIKKNQDKINKLIFINEELENSKQKLLSKQEPAEPVPPTKEERIAQSQRDKEEFKFKLSKRFS